ncbi:uncharacterized protein EI90DRAFT_3074093 [Cantharellus anzutake]|uniref:uncharacterized protein n=1 Tax=Cantharellus anzutake TaxID=1750568 RepID=UPI0019076F70|nr:uncharacterized protein EI90DRAFT_3074093 [Cantharellus anzutake]KAF8324843.1 hypothetical protein EI90DRAFT_3074093 [Cantharellus anzutake]
MAFATRRRPPALDTAIASYQPTQYASDNPVLSDPSNHSAAGPSRSRSPTGRGVAVVNDENEPVVPYPAEDDQFSPAGDDFVLAMHDFVPVAANVQCLSFRAGQVVRVHNRDPTGWWDGELEGRRGWFPSNYVSAQATGSTHSPPSRHKRSRIRHRHHLSRDKSLRSSNSRGKHAQTSPSEDTHGVPAVLVSLVQALSLLQNAVTARRINHFQPSTACVISCVRSVLSATDCLGRDSPALAQFPKLASARKVVLTDLAKLVAQARKASEFVAPDDEELDFEIGEMMSIGETVYLHVRMFLNVAVDCGLQLPERKGSSPVEEAYERAIAASNRPPGDDIVRGRRLNDDRDASSSKLRARSMVDFRRSRSALPPNSPLFQPSDPQPPPIPSSANTSDAEQTPGYASHGFFRRAPSPKSTHNSGSSMSSLGADADADAAVNWPAGPTSTPQVLVTLRTTHDRLLSIIAAFIGHVHSHSQSAHASSKGHLIEMTRETVDQVRQLLALVDSVMATPEVVEQKPREFMQLESAKSNLFAYTSSLVDSIRAITSLRASENEDEEKGTCLQAATGALRAGAECVTSVKLCLSRRIGEEPFTIFVLPPPSTDPHHPPRAGSPTVSIPYSRYTTSTYGETIDGPYGPSLIGSVNNHIATDLPVVQHDTEPPSSLVEDPTLRPTRDPSSDAGLNETKGQVTRDSLEAPPSVGSRGSRTPVTVKFPRSAPNIAIKIDDVPVRVSAEYISSDDVDSGFVSQGRQSFEPLAAPPRPDSAVLSDSARPDHPPRSLLEAKMEMGVLPALPSSSPTIESVDEASVPTEIELMRKSDDPDAWLMMSNFDSRDQALNADGTLIGATLEVLVEKMTPALPTPDSSLAAAFYLTFRLFTTPDELLTAVISRFSISPPNPSMLTPTELRMWHDRKLVPVRVRVCNLLNKWLELHWKPEQDSVVILRLKDFIQEKMVSASNISAHVKRIADVLEKREQEANDVANGPKALNRAKSNDRLKPRQVPPPGSTSSGVPPTPVMHRTLHNSLIKTNFSAISITDFDILELARQLTLIESRLYCAIKPEELLASGQAGVRPADSVRAVTSLSTSITGWVTECILNESDTKKRTGLLKYFIKLADRCLNQLNNFSTLRAVMAALDSSTISRLTKTWAGLSSRSRTMMDALRRVVDHSRNHAEYRSRLRALTPPVIPFLGIYLTDIIFCRDGNPQSRASPQDPSRTLLNFHRYHQLARIVQGTCTLHAWCRPSRVYYSLSIQICKDSSFHTIWSKSPRPRSI